MKLAAIRTGVDNEHGDHALTSRQGKLLRQNEHGEGGGKTVLTQDEDGETLELGGDGDEEEEVEARGSRKKTRSKKTS
jgi:hypothetical protein